MEAYSQLPAKADSKAIKPFALHIDQSKVDNMLHMVRSAPLGPRTFENLKTDRSMGMTYDWLSKATEYWTTQFSW